MNNVFEILATLCFGSLVLGFYGYVFYYFYNKFDEKP